MAPAAVIAGAGNGHDSGGLGEPLLANGGGEKVQSVEDDKYWADIDQPEALEPGDLEGGRRRPLLFRNKRVKRTILYPYRFLILARLIAIIFFFIWRVKNNTADMEWLWALSVAGDVWFGFSWLLNQLPRLNPIKSIPDLAALERHYGNDGDGLPGVDVFINTANPVDEPVLCTMNSVLSILAADYPAEKLACYLSDDAGALVHYEALADTARFAALRVPFCRKHRVERRAPERYFEFEPPCAAAAGGSPGEFVEDHRRVRREYEEFRARIGAIFDTVRRRSDAYNAAAAGRSGSGRGVNATWMADGTQWPGAWIDPVEKHMKGHYASIIQVVLEQPSRTPQLGQAASMDSPIDLSTTDSRLPMLVYVAREKHPTSYDHQKKAGAMNVQLRVSALLSNAPFIINFDCDHYINNPKALRAAMCFMLDPREGQDTAFVQFPQRFDGVDPTDRYCNHNRVFFDGTMLALNGLQGPSYLGTGCMFRRAALYGVEPPRQRRRASGSDVTVAEAAPSSSIFGNSMPFLESIQLAADENQDGPIMAPPPPRDESIVAELAGCHVMCLRSWDELGQGHRVGVQHRDRGRGDRLPHAPARVALQALHPGARGVPRHGADQPRRAPPPDHPVVRRVPGDVLLPQQPAQLCRRVAAPAAARGVPQHDHLPGDLHLHRALRPLPGHVAVPGGALHPAAVYQVRGVPRRGDPDDPRDRRLRDQVGGDDVDGLVEERAVLLRRRNQRVPGRGAVHGDQARHGERDPVQDHLQAAGPNVVLVRVPVGAAADPDGRGLRRQRWRHWRGAGEGGRVQRGVEVGAGEARRAGAPVQRVGRGSPPPVRAGGAGAAREEAGHPVGRVACRLCGCCPGVCRSA
ncbi:unnamed protein product [Urochloa humidicola]